jgi:inosine-uridine nucleoside N-ribohydrolase
LTKRTFIFDSDGGVDDAQALIMLVANGKVPDIVTTVFGNVGRDQATTNLLAVLSMLGVSVPVHRGAAVPMVQPIIDAKYVHGDDGLGGAPRPKSQEQHTSDDAIGVLIRTFKDAAAKGEKVDILMIGPLTNLAWALRLDQSILPGIGTLTIMGGNVYGRGNTTPAAEFNIYVDPEAADAVFHSGIPIVQAPLDLTHFMRANTERVERFRKLGNRTGVATAEMLEFFERFDVAKYGLEGAPLHDPCVIAYLLRPQLFQTKHVNVAIETSSDLTRGMTVVDWWGVTGRAKNVQYMRSGDADGFYELLFERLATLA